jgi:protein-tyrosine phosphatase
MEAYLHSNMVDLHCHILPALDDGPQSLEESLEMCRIAYRDGIRTVVAVAHTNNGIYSNDVQTVLAAVQRLGDEVKQLGLEMEILPGSDVFVDPAMLQMIHDGQVVTLNHPSRAVMLEFPEFLIPDIMRSFLESLINGGIVPVISHPERTPQFSDHSGLLRELVQMGALSQVTALSLTGGFGPRSQRIARALLERGLVHAIASDAHSIQHRPPVLSQAVEEAAKILGTKQALSLVDENPRAILRGERPKAPVVPASHRVRPEAAASRLASTAVQKIEGEHAIDSARDQEAAASADPSAASQTAARKPVTISIISNKGGVGKTHFSINLAYALTKAGAKVLLIDADLGNADISNKLGIFPERHLLDFLKRRQKMEDLIISTDYDFDLIGGASGEFRLANLNHFQKLSFISHFLKISRRYHFAIFDLGAGISRTVLDFALAADHTLILSTPQDIISGYACAKASFFRFKELEERLDQRLPDYIPNRTFSPMLVFNQVGHLKQARKLFQKVDQIADTYINTGESQFRIAPEYLGSIPYDKESLLEAEKNKRPLLHDLPHCEASQCFTDISRRFYQVECDTGQGGRVKNALRRFIAILSLKPDPSPDTSETPQVPIAQ